MAVIQKGLTLPAAATALELRFRDRPRPGGRDAPMVITFDASDVRRIVVEHNGQRTVIFVGVEEERLQEARLLDAVCALLEGTEGLPIGAERLAAFQAESEDWIQQQLSRWVESGQSLRHLATTAVDEATRSTLDLTSLKRSAMIEKLRKRLVKIYE